MSEQDPSKLHVDADWKAQARAEKEKLAEQAKSRSSSGTGAEAGGEAGAAPGGGAGGGAGGGLPPANFETLVSTMATQALFAMGAVADPRTGQRYQSLDLARHHIDMLGVIDEKTRGNLTDEESAMLANTLYELRTRYVQMASGGAGGAGGGGETGGAAPGAGLGGT